MGNRRILMSSPNEYMNHPYKDSRIIRALRFALPRATIYLASPIHFDLTRTTRRLAKEVNGGLDKIDLRP